MLFDVLLSWSLVTTCLVAMVTGLLAYWVIQKMKYNYPPGPKGLPLLGNILEIDKKILHMQAFEWSKKYGPVVTVWLGPMPILFVNTIDTVLEVLVKKSTDFAARQKTPTIETFTFGGKSIALSTYGPSWKLHRKISSTALRHYMQGEALEHRVHDAVETAFAEIDKVTGEFDPIDHVNFIVANILTGLCFGGKYAFDDPEVRYIVKFDDDLNEKLSAGTWEDYIPGLRYVYKTKDFRAVEQFVDEVYNKFFRRKLKECEQTFDRDNTRHFTDSLLLARLEANEDKGQHIQDCLTEDHLVQTLTEIFVGGIDTSRTTLAFVILHMVAFPDIQEKVQKEIDEVVEKDRMPGIADRPNLSYTEAVLHESMRLSSIAPSGVFHVTLCDTEVAGHKIPKGTTVAINHWALHHDPNAWEEVDKFVPERYLNEDGKLGPKPKNWLPFSAGKRVCLGEFVAKPELHLIFAALMQRYKWSMVSGKCPDLTPKGNFFGYEPQPFKVVVERRL